MTDPETPQPEEISATPDPATEEIADQEMKDLSGGYRRIFGDRPPRATDRSEN